MSSDSLEALLAQRAELDAKIAEQRAIRRNDVIEEIVALMREYEIAIREVEVRLAIDLHIGRVRRRVDPRFWDPQTGATWSGRGKRPRWMNGRDPEEFRLKPERMPTEFVQPPTDSRDGDEA
ncbi:H-NS histone family protein [Burkholderia ambifaria]|uniref:H-NS histone family protein n=1 Tax=Burkholderia ambifaria TaxID=152480 RepID=UPI001B9250BC|nr:H-NS histone family protein [Burkholderia ambifaria]MBR8334164.1 H-NS histone family protein [Burkholderia ambifaria]